MVSRLCSGFAPHELNTRFQDTRPKLVVTASGSIEVDKVQHYPPLVDEALKLYGHTLPVLCVHRPELGASVAAPSAWPANYRNFAELMHKHRGQRAAAVSCDAKEEPSVT